MTTISLTDNEVGMVITALTHHADDCQFYEGIAVKNGNRKLASNRRHAARAIRALKSRILDEHTTAVAAGA